MKQRSPTQTQTKPLSFTPVPTGLLQRKCSSCGQNAMAGGECSECSKKRQLLQRHATNQAESSEIPPIVHEVLRSPGQSLDKDTRSFMEPRFGHDFSHVRVHTDGRAAKSAQAVNARAYTVTQDVVFGAGQYSPSTITGKKLLAHELTHTLQQKGQVVAPHQPQLEIGSNHDLAETTAEQISRDVISNEVTQTPVSIPSLTASTAPFLQREPLPDVSNLRLRPSPEIARTMGMQLLDGFALDEAELTAEHQAQLTGLAPTLIDLLSAYPSGLVEITGHADATGTDSHNQTLGQRRAEAVRDALVAAGVSTEAIVISSAGESQLQVPTQAAEPRNRRVEIRFEPEPLRFFGRRSRSFNLGLDLSLSPPPPVAPIPPTRRPINLFPRMEFTPETPEDLLERMLRERPPRPPQSSSRSFNDMFWGFVDNGLNDAMDGLGIRSEFIRERIRDGAHSLIDKGIETGLNEAMDAADLGSEEQEAIRTTIRALRQYRPGSNPSSR